MHICINSHLHSQFTDAYTSLHCYQVAAQEYETIYAVELRERKAQMVAKETERRTADADR